MAVPYRIKSGLNSAGRSDKDWIALPSFLYAVRLACVGHWPRSTILFRASSSHPGRLFSFGCLLDDKGL